MYGTEVTEQINKNKNIGAVKSHSFNTFKRCKQHIKRGSGRSSQKMVLYGVHMVIVSHTYFILRNNTVIIKGVICVIA